MKFFFTSLFTNIVASFKGKKIWFHVFAIVLTVIIVFSGLDWYYFSYIYKSGLANIGYAVMVGGLVPLVLPLALIFAGIILDKRYNRYYGLFGAALAQAALLGSLISSAYKAFTGRVQPMLTDLSLQSSFDWNFGFLEHGVFWGWPSSHTTIAFAMAFCLIYLIGKNKKLSVLIFLYALWVGIGVSFRIHWFSEFIAGAFIGTSIGITVGKCYKARFDIMNRGSKL